MTDPDLPTAGPSDAPTVVITGALSGIGEAITLAFATLGARLVLGDKDVTRADTVLAAVSEAGGAGIVVETDVRDAQALDRLAAAALDTYGGIDVLVANAGIAEQSSSADGDPERWRNVIATNLLGTLFAVRSVLPTLIRQARGDIFVIASLSGRETYVGEPAYIASKWGQVGYVHALRQEVLEHNVRVCLVEPGLVDTPLAQSNPKALPLLSAITPLAASDIANLIIYAWQQPANVTLSELAIRPVQQRPF